MYLKIVTVTYFKLLFLCIGTQVDTLLGFQSIHSVIYNHYSANSKSHFNHILQASSSQHPIISPSVWTVFGDLASKTGATNLGQGFPDWQPPEFLLDALTSTIKSPNHQYTRPAGHPPLVKSLASAYTEHLDRPIDAFNEVCVTVGASQALYLSLMTLLKSSDEIVIFEPYFDLYLKQIKLIPGVTTRFVSLGGDAATEDDPWALDINLLKKSITSKTKVLILNSPHNPTGKVFTRSEMEQIAEIVRDNPQITVISDEVYKFSIYDPLETGDSFAKGHYHFARLPDMWDRTITLSSCGKTFSVTGWQVGWMVGPSKYIAPVQELIPCVQFCASTPIQSALAIALPIARNEYMGYPTYYEWLRSQFQTKRKILENGLKLIGVTPLPSRGGFFLLAKLPTYFDAGSGYKDMMITGYSIDEKDNYFYSNLRDSNTIAAATNDVEKAIADFNTVKTHNIAITSSSSTQYTGDLHLPRPISIDEPYDWKYCRLLATAAGVVGIPASPFFTADSVNAKKLGPMARFAFCKKDKTIENAYKKLNLSKQIMKPDMHNVPSFGKFINAHNESSHLL